MKVILKYGWVCMILLLAVSCVKDESVSPNGALSKTYNNGMIKSYSNETVIKWNQFLSASIDNRMPQPAEAKIYAMVTLGIHDALNNVVPKYDTYALDNTLVNASEVSKKNIKAIADAAVSQAAHDLINALYPLASSNSDALLNSCLSEITDDVLRTKGTVIGQNAAAAVLQKRQGDFPLRFMAFTGTGTLPGDFQANFMPWMVANPPIWPANAVYAPNLGSLMPFGANAGHQFRNEVPFSVNSQDYVNDYNEVKSLGCNNCPERTPLQTEIGAFWIETSSSAMNRMARTLSVQENLNGWETARLIALIGISQMDAFIASFDGKYHYNFWRPITAIRSGENDGNSATAGDVSWTPSFTTPPTPEFPSTHAYCGGAATEVFKLFFKTNSKSFVVTSPYYLPNVTRQMTSFDQVSRENAESRIYIGYHFRHAVEVGERQGKLLGAYVFNHNLKEIK
jgi:hypothetical protein